MYVTKALLCGAVALLSVMDTGLSGIPPELRVWGRVASRQALVVGVGDYPSMGLSAPVPDAHAMERSLESMGFEVTSAINSTGVELVTRVHQFQSSLKPDGLALFYFSGHGYMHDGRSYFIPADVGPLSERDIGDGVRSCVELGPIIETCLSHKGMKVVVILDCGGHPDLPVFGRDVAEREFAENLVVFSASAPMRIAIDVADDTGHGPFVASWLDTQREDFNISIIEALRMVSRRMLQSHGQRPWLEFDPTMPYVPLGVERARNPTESGDVKPSEDTR